MLFPVIEWMTNAISPSKKPVMYTQHRYPCIDKYPKTKQFITNAQIMKEAKQVIKKQGLKGKLSASKVYKKLKASFRVDSIWDTDKYPVLNIYFMDGSQKQQSWVRSIVTEHIQPLLSNLKLNWESSQQNSQIRISFALHGQAWSTVGTDALLVPITDPTMNLGWLDDDTQYGAEPYKNTGQVVLHEFGHALGMIHEHQNPKGNEIVWNKPVVYEALARTNKWSPQQVDHNMFKKYGDAELCNKAKQLPKGPDRRVQMENYCVGELVNGSSYDVTSIMHYFYPADWILRGPTEIPVNLKFSDLDKKWLRKYYGVPPTKPTAETKEETADIDQPTTKTEEETTDIDEPTQNCDSDTAESFTNQKHTTKRRIRRCGKSSNTPSCHWDMRWDV